MSEDRVDRDTGEIVETHAPPPAIGGEMRPLASRETMEIMTALHRAQGMMEAPKRTKTATVEPRDPKKRSYTYSYAPIEEIYRVIKQPFAENGLLRQEYMVSRGAMWFVRTIVWHTSGQWISGDFPVFADMTSNSFKAGVTTARRIGTSMLCGLAPEDDEDHASQPEAKPAVVGNSTTKPEATRANSVVAPDNPELDPPRRAYRALQRAIDTSSDAAALREVYDAVLDVWGGMFEQEVSMIRETHPGALELLKTRLQTRLQQIGG